MTGEQAAKAELDAIRDAVTDAAEAADEFDEKVMREVLIEETEGWRMRLREIEAEERDE